MHAHRTVLSDAIKIDLALVAKWKHILMDCGLDSDCMCLTSEQQDQIVPEGTAPPQKSCRAATQQADRQGIKWHSYRAILVHIHDRRVHEWAYSDVKPRISLTVFRLAYKTIYFPNYRRWYIDTST
jgi:hypothetical protein